MAESEEIFTTMIAKQAEKWENRHKTPTLKREKQERTKDSEGNKNESECQASLNCVFCARSFNDNKCSFTSNPCIFRYRYWLLYSRLCIRRWIANKLLWWLWVIGIYYSNFKIEKIVIKTQQKTSFSTLSEESNSFAASSAHKMPLVVSNLTR